MKGILVFKKPHIHKISTMQIRFYKYQGAGNYFIMIDDRDKSFPAVVDFVNHLCDRRFGIGADGLILLQKAEGYDFEMVYFNSDGNPASMCGNGGRCTAAFAQQLGLGKGEYHFLAVDGPHKAILKADLVSLQMKNVDQISIHDNAMVLDTGSPHYVQFMDHIESIDAVSLGRAIRYNTEFKAKGINVNFISPYPGNPEHIHIRTYERGVEDETLACGTGVVASALSWFSKNRSEDQKSGKQKIHVSALGGELEVDFEYHPDASFSNIWLTGPAERVFEGRIDY